MHIKLLKWVLAIAFIFTAPYGFAKIATNNPVVGKVTLLIGDTRVTGPMRSGMIRLKSGADVYPGDIVVTRASGHAHLRFIDGALMSIRPSSRLTIQEYNYDPQTPTNNRVSFTLEEGVARSISGKAAKDARENFRMNTPVAAIGVRGTDFIVQTGSERTRALVTEGGIVLSGLDTACIGGWCGELELHGGSKQLLEVDLATSEPRFMRSSYDEVITSTLLNSSIALVQVNAAQEGMLAEQKTPEKTVTAIAVLESTTELEPASSTAESESTTDPTKPTSPVVAATSPAPTQSTSTTSESATSESATEPEPIVAVKESSSEIGDLVVASDSKTAVRDESGKLINSELIATSDLLLIPEMPPKPIEPSEPVESVKTTALIWGYLNTNQDTLPEFVQTQAAFDELNKTHHETEIGNEAYALYRRNEYNQVINPFLPELKFALNDASAWLNWHAYREPMEVGSGMLVIDFDRGVFSTQIQLSHERTGQIFFNASGTTKNTGHFNHESNNQNLQGIVSLNGKEAAYLFNQSLPRVEGEIDGITLWGIKK